MARPASGRDFLEQAKECVCQAKTVRELRQAQAVLLPLLLDLKLEQVAVILGVSKSWTCRLRREFIRAEGKVTPPVRGGRRRAHMTPEEEVAFLEPFFEKAAEGGILVVSEIKQALDTYLGRKVALSSIYNLLHRHGWRKIVPDKRHPKADVEAQEDWKKNFQNFSKK